MHTRKNTSKKPIFNLENKMSKIIPRVTHSFAAAMRTYSSLHQLVCVVNSIPMRSFITFMPPPTGLSRISNTDFSERKALASRLMSSTQAASL